MTKLQHKLNLLLEYYRKTIGIGHTHLLNEGIDNYSYKGHVAILALNEKTSRNVKSNTMTYKFSWSRFDNNTLRGKRDPLAIDNGAMIAILEDTLATFKEKDMEISSLKDQLSDNDSTIKEKDKEIQSLKDQLERLIIDTNIHE